VHDLLIQIKVSTPADHLSREERLPSWVKALPSWVKAKDSKQLQRNDVHNADVIVAKDGNFTRVTDVVSAASEKSTTRYIIHIKKGVYQEDVIINQDKRNLMMIGDGMHAKIITGNLSTTHINLSTYNTTTFLSQNYLFIVLFSHFLFNFFSFKFVLSLPLFHKSTF